MLDSWIIVAFSLLVLLVSSYGAAYAALRSLQATKTLKRLLRELAARDSEERIFRPEPKPLTNRVDIQPHAQHLGTRRSPVKPAGAPAEFIAPMDRGRDIPGSSTPSPQPGTDEARFSEVLEELHGLRELYDALLRENARLQEMMAHRLPESRYGNYPPPPNPYPGYMDTTPMESGLEFPPDQFAPRSTQPQDRASQPRGPTPDLTEGALLQVLEGLKNPARFESELRAALQAKGWHHEVVAPSSAAGSVLEVRLENGQAWIVPFPERRYNDVLRWYHLPPGRSRDEWCGPVETLASRDAEEIRKGRFR